MIANPVSSSRSFRSLTAALVAVLWFAVSLPVQAQSSPAAEEPHRTSTVPGSPIPSGVPKPAVAHDPAAPASPDSSKGALAEQGQSGTHQGVSLHGHWVIDVRNPDGTLAQHRDFENSLAGSAQGLLVGLLAGYFTQGQLMIAMGATSGNAACAATAQVCGIVQNLNYYPAAGYCNSYYCTGSVLTVTPNFGPAGAGPYSLVLAGSITANQTGTIGTVSTIYNSCADSAAPTFPTTVTASSPSTCASNVTNTFYGPLSNATLTSPVPVSAGQIIQVTVTITFS
jgi:hypothetical protein